MPYISTEQVSKIRKAIKSTFPNFKFSIVKEHHSTINITILEAPLDFKVNERGYAQVNTFHLKESFSSEQLEVLTKLYDMCKTPDFNNQIVYDGDYGAIPSYYIRISIGSWDKPFKYIDIETKRDNILNKILKTKNVVDYKKENLSIVDYSEKAIAVFGDTKPIKEQLKELGGRFNPNLIHPSGEKKMGWIFPKKKSDEVKKVIEISNS
jgi:hypothetical protein